MSARPRRVRPLLVAAVFLALACGASAKNSQRRGAKKLGDWRDLSKRRAWSDFDKSGRPFDPSVNLAICRRHTITIGPDRSNKDFSVAINAALKRLRTLRPPGGTVRLLAGRYVIARQLHLPSYTCLIGAGMRSTTLRVRSNSKPFRLAGAVRSLHSERVTLSDLTIDGNRRNQRSRSRRERYGRYGFFSELTNYLYMRRVATVNNLGYGFDPHGSKREWAYYLLLENCDSRNNGLDGFTLDQTVYVGVRGCTGSNNARHGTNIVTGTRYLDMRKCTMRDNGFDTGVGCNIMAQNNQRYGTRHLRLTGNTATNARKGGYCLNDVSDVMIRSSRVSNRYRRSFCYYFMRTRDVTVRSSTCAPSRGRAGVTRLIRGARAKFMKDSVRAPHKSASVGRAKRSGRTSRNSAA